MQAGQLLEAGRFPGERIGTLVENTNSVDVTSATDVLIDTIIVPLVIGRTYSVDWRANVAGDAVGDIWVATIREDNATGVTNIQTRGVIHTASALGFNSWMHYEYTAASTGDKTFVILLSSAAGDTVRAVGASNRPRYLYVDYLFG